MKTLAILLAGASALAMASAAHAETVRISGWGGTEVAIVNSLITDVLKDEIAAAGIEVAYEPVDGDFSQFILNGLSAGTAPDLFYTDIFWSRSIFSAGQAEPVSADLSAFDPNLVAAFTYDGTVMSIPKDFNTLALHFDMVGVSWNKALGQPRARAFLVIAPQLRQAFTHGTQPQRQQSLPSSSSG